jgi:hypothetical protein
MKISSFVVSLLAAASVLGAESPRIVRTGLAKAYIPVGFDTNDVPQLYVTGELKDTCHQVGPVAVDVDGANRRITVSQAAYRYPGPDCWPMPLAYGHVVNLPVLEREGDYEVFDGNSGAKLGTLSIAEAATSGPGTDNFLYAPVEAVQLKRTLPGKLEIIVSGNFPSDCMAIKSVKITFQKDVIVVLPIVEMRQPADRACSNGKFPFYEERPLNRLLGNYPYLFHVRSLAGQSINRLLDPYAKEPGPINP